MYRRLTVFLLLLLLGTGIYSCKKKEEKKEFTEVMTVTVGEFGVPEKRVAASFEFSKEFQKNKVITPELLKEYINRYYLGEIFLLAEAKAQGLDQEPEFLKAMKKHKVEQMTKANGPLYKAILPKDFKVDNEEIEILYQHLPYRLTLKQILVTPKFLADSIYQALKKGADFGTLAKKYSNDLRSALNGGVIPSYITAGMAAPEFEQAAFALTEEQPLSKPVKTEFGYHIIKLVAREKINVGSKIQEKLKLVEIAKTRGRNAFIQRYIDSLFTKYHFKINETYFPAILQGFKRQGLSGMLVKERIPEQVLHADFLVYDKGKWTVEDFADAYNNFDRYGRYRLEYADDIRIMARKLISRELMYWDGVERGLTDDPIYKKFIDYYYHHELEKLGEQRLIEDNIKISDAEIKEYFKKHRNLWKNDPFERVKPYVRNRILVEKRNQFRKDFMAYLRKKYKDQVHYNEASVQRLVNLMNQRKKLRASK